MEKASREFYLSLKERQGPQLTSANDIANHIAKATRSILYCIEKSYKSAFSSEIYHQKNDDKIKYQYRIELICESNELDLFSIIDEIVDCLARVVKFGGGDNEDGISSLIEGFCNNLKNRGCDIVNSDEKYMIREKLDSIVGKLSKNKAYYKAEILRCESKFSHNKQLTNIDDVQPDLFGGRGIAISSGEQRVASELPSNLPPYDVRGPVGPAPSEDPQPFDLEGKKDGRIKGEFYSISLAKSKPSIIRIVGKNIYYPVQLPDDVRESIRKVMEDLFGKCPTFEISLVKNKNKCHEVYRISE